MKFAFSTAACPPWEYPALAAKAREYGYDGVELLASDDATLPAGAGSAFDSAGVEIACVSGPVVWTGRGRDDEGQSERVRSLIRLAHDLGCPRVVVGNSRLRPGHGPLATAVALAERLGPLADEALARGVTLLLANSPGLRSAREVWAVLDRLRHPAVGCCWDPLDAALAGESPALSVPTLNSRIRYARVRDARVRDARLDPAGFVYREPGEGDVGLAKFIERLRGVGYDGYLTAAWEAARLPAGADPLAWLAHASARLKAWSAAKAGHKGPSRDKRKSDAALAGG